MKQAKGEKNDRDKRRSIVRRAFIPRKRGDWTPDRARRAEFSPGPFPASSLRLDPPSPPRVSLCIYTVNACTHIYVYTHIHTSGEEEKKRSILSAVVVCAALRRAGRVQDRRAVSALARLTRVGDTKV